MDNFVEIGERLLLSICLPTLEAYQSMMQILRKGCLWKYPVAADGQYSLVVS
jgi:hypothetical protein